MKEEFLYYIWKYQLFKGEISTTNNEQLKVHSIGTINTDSGPDFFNALIEINGTIWAGNVEMHLKSSDWINHNHHKDKAYNTTILHVVLENDSEVITEEGTSIPTLELSKHISKELISRYLNLESTLDDIPCNMSLGQINQITITGWYDYLIMERLESRYKEFVRNRLNNKGDTLEIFYQSISRSFGNRTNSDCMESLARITPLKLLLPNKTNLGTIEALLFGQSGLLSSKYTDSYASELFKEYNYLRNKHSLSPMLKQSWKFMRMRPASFPTIRISQFANLLYYNSCEIMDFFESDSVNDLKKRLKVDASSYWGNHYRFGKHSAGKLKILGETTIDIIIINSIIPFMFNYGKINNKQLYCDKAIGWLTSIKQEENRITRKYNSQGMFALNALESQAMIQLYKYYCLKKRCLSCRFGHLFLRRTH